MRTCYYELLGCSRAAGGDEIKKVTQTAAFSLNHSANQFPQGQFRRSSLCELPAFHEVAAAGHMCLHTPHKSGQSPPE